MYLLMLLRLLQLIFQTPKQGRKLKDSCQSLQIFTEFVWHILIITFYHRNAAELDNLVIK